LSDQTIIFIGDYSLIILQSEWWDCPLHIYRSTKNFVKFRCL